MYWAGISRGANQFIIQKSEICHKNPKYSAKWKVEPKTSAKERAQSFAGMHAATSSTFTIIDEASEVDDSIWQPIYSCATDGEPFIFAWGQMLKNSGEFYKITFGDASQRWDTRIWDGRESVYQQKPNKRNRRRIRRRFRLVSSSCVGVASSGKFASIYQSRPCG